MNIIEKCELITNNSLFNNIGMPGRNNEIDLEIYNEIKDELTKKIESIINPIIQEYKKSKKRNFYGEHQLEEVNDILINEYIIISSREVYKKINPYLTALKDINKKIEEITSNND